jgi:hypothetical protein
MRPSVSRSLDDWKRDFDLMKASGITGIIPEIYNGRQTLFRSTRLPVRAPVARIGDSDRYVGRSRSTRLDVVHAVPAR